MTEKKVAAGWPRDWNQDVAGELARPFHPDIVKWRPGSKNKDGSKAMALAYIDARDVMDRLDQCVGPNGWTTHFATLNDDRQAVSCALTVLGVTKQDVGYPNGRNDEEPYKAAFSDALKRAAVHFGIGRELYDTPQFWLPIDNYGRFSATPAYVVGKGWVAPGQEPPREQQSPASGGSKASDAMRRKVFAALKETGLDAEEQKGLCQSLTGKASSTDWTVADVDVLLRNLADMKKAA